MLANDSDPDGDPLTLVAVRDAPMHGTTTPVEGGVEYLAAPGYAGPDSFTYEISDGELTAVATVSVTVTSDANTAPVASDDSVTTRWGSPVTVDVTANDSDADGDPLSVVRIWRPEHGGAQLVDGQVLYTPRGRFIGSTPSGTRSATDAVVWPRPSSRCRSTPTTASS